MKRGQRMTQEDFEGFHTTISMWFGLRICTSEQLAARVGCRRQMINRIRRKDGRTTYKMAGEIMDAIGQIEAKYITKWQQERARQRLGGRVVETYRAGMQHESH